MLKGSQPSSSSSPPSGTVIESKSFICHLVTIVIIKKKHLFNKKDFHANKVDNIHVHCKLQNSFKSPLAKNTKKNSPFIVDSLILPDDV